MIKNTLGRTIIVLAIVMPILANAQGKPEEKKIPDFSNTPRKDIPKEYTWRIEDVYPDVAAWRADKEKVSGMFNQIAPPAERMDRVGKKHACAAGTVQGHQPEF